MLQITDSVVKRNVNTHQGMLSTICRSS